MRHLVAVAVAASTLGALVACGPRPGPDLAQPAEPSSEPVVGVMRRKVVHAQTLVVGVARAEPRSSTRSAGKPSGWCTTP
ncbi:MAG: hypothetical protein ACYSUF_08445 [Planctomycetota bacterium]